MSAGADRTTSSQPDPDLGAGGHATGVTEGFPASTTATQPQFGAAGPAGAGWPPSRGLGRRRWLVLVGCAVLGIALGVTSQRLVTTGSDPVASPTPSAGATAPVEAKITPVAAAGSSFTRRDGAWRSQTYSDADFGNLKEGIGLLLDLGTARPLTAVTFTTQTGPLTVELRAGDKATDNGADYTLVGPAVQANGATTLSASAGGSHRYWMIWVTKLPPSEFQARIADPVARG